MLFSGVGSGLSLKNVEKSWCVHNDPATKVLRNCNNFSLPIL
jgi:hypothetical protein